MVRCTTRVWMAGVAIGFALMLSEGGLGKNAWAHPPHLSGGKVSAEPEIIFGVRNYAHLSAATLRRVETVATRVFVDVGIRSQWDAPVVDEPLECMSWVKHPGIPVIYVNILPPEMASRLNLPGDCLGYSPLTRSGGSPYVAGVLYERAQKAARGGPATVEDLLGYAIAHEVGHLLLHSTSHSRMGIMQARWGPEDLERISQGRLYFRTQESAGMRAELATRAASERARAKNLCAQAATLSSNDATE